MNATLRADDPGFVPFEPVISRLHTGRRTEIDELNGFVVAEGKRLGVPTPFNEAVVREVHRHGVGTLKPDPKNLEPLAAMLPQLAEAAR